MPYQSPPGRFSRQSWDELNDEIKQAENEHLMEGIVAGCALVAYADGRVTDDEHDRMVSLIRRFEPIAAFGVREVVETFEAATSRFTADPTDGEAAALKAVAKVKGAGKYPVLLIKTCCSIADADGGFDAAERKAVIRICGVLGLDPAKFGIVDAS
jgi:tellurite resistance protein TerB